MKKQLLTLLAGMALGMALLSGGYAAASTALTAKPSSQAIYVNGQQVQFEAYSIHGNNFVKLRDIGKAVDFGVTYDGSTNSVHIDPGAPYQEETPQPVQPTPTPAPAGEYTISADHWSREDFSQQANPAVFTGVYDRALYNTIRQTLVDGGAGSAPAYTMVAQGADYSAVAQLLGRMNGVTRYEHYVPENFTNYWQYLNYFAVSAKVPENFLPAVDYIQPVINHVNQLGSDREKVTYLNDYLCTLLAYDPNKTAGIPQAFASRSGELEAACGSYAEAFRFLCEAASVPCISVRSSSHAWNLVYADGQWLYVDVTVNDNTNSHTALLRESYPRHTDREPAATAFLKELLVPGSTK